MTKMRKFYPTMYKMKTKVHKVLDEESCESTTHLGDRDRYRFIFFP